MHPRGEHHDQDPAGACSIVNTSGVAGVRTTQHLQRPGVRTTSASAAHVAAK
ncbi:hypothetical protein [Streptomyces sp. NPDC048442]|uniref:hypothetical protein n=1 Tax=Streptomyces sp. NPDC048442 TaxID=3154823 RepID=UPI003448F50B